MAKRSDIPVYKLYGEQAAWPTPDLVHCESIAERSRLHNWHIKPHRHHGLFQILFIQSGNARIHLDDRHSEMHAGQVLMVPQNCIHGFEFDLDVVGYVLTLAYPLINKVTKQLSEGLAALTTPSLHVLSDDEESDYIRTAFSALDREYRRSALHRDVLMEALLGAILIWLTRHATQAFPGMQSETARGSRHFARFCELVEECYAQHFPVAHYAKQIGVTPAHLNLLCRQKADRSALGMIHERLLLEARRNLIYTSMTISEVSYAIGFSDPAYFTRFFKREAGLSPKEFRRRAGT